MDSVFPEADIKNTDSPRSMSIAGTYATTDLFSWQMKYIQYMLTGKLNIKGYIMLNMSFGLVYSFFQM